LVAARERWKEIGAEELMLRGITAEWKEEESPRRLERERNPAAYSPKPAWAQEYRKLLEEEIREGIVVEIEEEEAKWFNPTFLVEKAKKGKFMKILDCRRLNEELADEHFKLEGADVVCALIQPGDWATSINVKSAFSHVPVSEELSPYLTFQFEGRTYRYVGMPFGIKHAPRVFTLLMRKVMVAIRERFPVRAVSYMDDILLLFADVRDAVTKTWDIIHFVENLGWTLAEDKCETDPTQDIDFLGWRWHLEEATVTATPGKKAELLKDLRVWQE
jgi:hypothetical protein